MAFNPEHKDVASLVLGSPDSKKDNFALAAKKAIEEKAAAEQKKRDEARINQLTLEFLSALPNKGKFFKN